MLPPEDSYGSQKRVRFFREVIDRHAPKTVLDIGCGTGTVSAALAAVYPQVQFLGVDSDRRSLEHAQSRTRSSNLRFLYMNELRDSQKFDLIVASEVIEHVEAPSEFLRFIRGKLAKEGYVILTLPNGYGPFEIMGLVEGVIRVSGLYSLLSAIKRAVPRSQRHKDVEVDTLAVSPHVNFFSYRAILHLIAASGFNILEYRARTFLCGFLLDRILTGSRFVKWNAVVADRLPPYLISDWMFLLKATRSEALGVELAFGIYQRLHRYINKKAAGLA